MKLGITATSMLIGAASIFSVSAQAQNQAAPALPSVPNGIPRAGALPSAPQPPSNTFTAESLSTPVQGRVQTAPRVDYGK
jgi:hypothetical protein